MVSRSADSNSSPESEQQREGLWSKPSTPMRGRYDLTIVERDDGCQAGRQFNVSVVTSALRLLTQAHEQQVQ
jgi:hypothetical protein